MAVIDDIATRVQDRLDEVEGSPGVFWNLQYELRPLVVEALFEATLLTGLPEIRQTAAPFEIPANTTFLNVPSGAVAIVRVEGCGLERNKVSLFDMDMDTPGWQTTPAAATPKRWFPVGLNLWGVWPQVTAPVTVILTTLAIPVATAPPYQGTENVDFQSEFFSGFEAYGAAWSRLKEGDPEMSQGIALYEYYLSVVAELSKFSLRQSELRFSKLMGSPAVVNDIERK